MVYPKLEYNHACASLNINFLIAYHNITVVTRKYAPPFCNLSLSTKRRGGLYAGCDTLPRDREMFSGSVDAGFVLALPFHHGDLEPDCVGVSRRGGGFMRG